MIRFVNRYSIPIEQLPISAFNCIDTETNMLMEDSIIKRECYYVYHIGKDTDRYQRVIALNFVNVCETNEEDDLSNLGFEYIRQTPQGHKMWMRK